MAFACFSLPQVRESSLSFAHQVKPEICKGAKYPLKPFDLTVSQNDHCSEMGDCHWKGSPRVESKAVHSEPFSFGEGKRDFPESPEKMFCRSQKKLLLFAIHQPKGSKGREVGGGKATCCISRNGQQVAVAAQQCKTGPNTWVHREDRLG